MRRDAVILSKGLHTVPEDGIGSPSSKTFLLPTLSRAKLGHPLSIFAGHQNPDPGAYASDPRLYALKKRRISHNSINNRRRKYD